MILDELIKENALTVDNIRELVDDYSIYSYYIGQELELKTKYSSPLRDGDNDPSFSLFESYGNLPEGYILFKDHASIGSGDVFKFVQILFGINFVQALQQINSDFDLGLGGIEEKSTYKPRILKKVPVVRENKRIRIKSKPYSKVFLDYWYKKYGVTESTLKMYEVFDVQYVIYEGKETKTCHTPKELLMAYMIGGFYKLYAPFACKSDKFRNNFPPNYIEGYIQIDWTRSDFVVITKAMKECIFFRQHWNIQAVAGKSENTMIPDFIIYKLLDHFDRVYLWLDPDEAGVAASNKYKEKYPGLIECTMPSTVVEKDPTDFYEVHRINHTTELIKFVLKL